MFEHTFTVAREFQGFLEPRACVVWIDEDDRVHVINTNKAPATFRRQLAAGLGIPADRIVIDTTFIGGDFGGKGLSIDEYACYSPGESDRPADQGGDELSRRDAGEQLAPSRDPEAPDRRRP